MSAKYLRWLLDQTGWNVRTAVGSYYQGLGAMRAHGLYADTVAYVEHRARTPDQVLSAPRRCRGRSGQSGSTWAYDPAATHPNRASAGAAGPAACP